MSDIGAALAEKARRVVTVQLLTSLVVAALFMVQGAWEALSAFYGGLVSVVLALLSIWGFRRANVHALSDPKRSMMILYAGAVQRFVAVLVLLALGLGFFALDPLAVFIGFALAQAGYLMGTRSDASSVESPDGKL